MKTVFIIVFLFFHFLKAQGEYEKNDERDRLSNEIIKFHLERKTFDSKIWKKLLHIEKDGLGFLHSQVKGPKFFLAPTSDWSAETELVATLRGFWLDDGLGDDHPICRFPARLEFLKKQSSAWDGWSYLPKPNCKYLNIYWQAMNPKSVSFVFSSYYANNPGSAFGHTFFRINKKKENQIEPQELLDYGISYAANVTSENPVIYALFGLFGGFSGTFTNVPYYYKIREYNDFESRDLWSYELNLSDSELVALLNHLWELGPHYFNYYFFTQNCSYHMLTALETIRDNFDFTNKIPAFVIPIDTVKAVKNYPGLIKKIEYRPSLRKVFEARLSRLNNQDKKDFETIVGQSVDQLNLMEWWKSKSTWEESRKAKYLDAMIDYIDLKDPSGIVQRRGGWFGLRENVLTERARLNHISENIEIPLPKDDQPHDSHPSSRLTILFGRNSESKNQDYLGLEWRFAFHDFLDSSKGLPAYSQLEFGHFKIHIFKNEQQIKRFSLFNLKQLNPWKSLDSKTSWAIDLGFEELPFCDGDCISPGLKINYGWAVETNNFLFWTLPYIHVRHDSRFYEQTFYGALGVEFGSLWHLGEKFKIMASYYSEHASRFSVLSYGEVKARYNLETWASELRWKKRIELSTSDQFEAGILKYF